MREQNEKEYINNTHYHNHPPFQQEKNQIKQSYYDNNGNNSFMKSINDYDSSFKKDSLYFNNNCNKIPNFNQESQIKDEKQKIGWNDNYDWLLHDNSIKKVVRVIKADEFLSKPLDNSISNNKNVLLNTTAIQNMFKDKNTLSKDSPEVKNVMRKLDFNE